MYSRVKLLCRDSAPSDSATCIGILQRIERMLINRLTASTSDDLEDVYD